MFHQTFISRVVTAIATVPFALSVGLSAPEAKANHHFDYCTTINGVDMCANAGDYYDEVVLAKGNEFEVLQIRCTASRNIFQSRGHLTQLQAEQFVDGYCQGRRGY